MNQIGKDSAFGRLLEYEKRGAQFQPGAKNGGGRSEEWSGITFGLGEARLACNIDRVAEILPCPQSTPVPGAKAWIAGLANVRGELLTVIDLKCFLTGSRAQVRSNSRLLATSLNKAPIGLLIDEVFGQRHFLDSDAVAAQLPDDSPLHSVVTRQHQHGAVPVLEPAAAALFNSAEFLNGAAH